MLAKAQSANSDSWGYVNQLGEFAISPRFLRCHPFSENSISAAYDADRRTIVLFNSTGSEIELEKELTSVGEARGFDSKVFTGPLAPVMVDKIGPMDGKWGYIDSNGQLVVKARYEEASNYNSNRAVVSTGREFLILDDKGEEIKIPIKKVQLVEPFSEGLAAYLSNEGRWGFMNTSGESVITPAYRSVGKMSEGLVWFKNNSHNVGFIDKKGNEVIKPIYQTAFDFSDGLALVENEDGKWLYVDREGREMIPSKADKLKSFKDGLAVASLNEQYGFIDKTGSWAISPKYEETLGFQNGYAPVKINSNWGFINLNGEMVIGAEFSELGHFEFTTVAVDSDGDDVRDELDHCPDVAGNKSANGCPDEDRDGIKDEIDQCPNTELRLAVNENGCPDRDQDGCFENEDLDDYQEGPKECGCIPCPDSDSDGIPDNEDKCPSVSGPVELGGCPEVKEVKKLSKRDRQLLFSISFSSNQTALTAFDEHDLDGVLREIKDGGREGELETASFLIQSSIDPNEGDDKNLEAEARVHAVAQYLKSNGIDAYRIKEMVSNENPDAADLRVVKIFVMYRN